MKTLTYYKETKELLKFISKNWPDLSIGMMKLILAEANEVLEERNEIIVTVKSLDLDY